MVLGREVGSARVTITDVATKQILATGIQQGEAGDQNQIMRTPRLMGEPLYSSRPAAAFTTTLDLLHPTLVEITAEGPLAYPAAAQHVSKTVWLIPGQDLTNDGIVLSLYGYIIQIEHPKPGEPLIAKEDVPLRASVRTLSGALVRPHGDWDSRKTHIYGELMIGDRVLERLQMFYSGERATFEAPFFVPLPKIAQSPSETGARSREAGHPPPPGSSEGGVPPSWGFYKGASPLVGVGEAGSSAEPAREEGIRGTVC